MCTSTSVSRRNPDIAQGAVDSERTSYPKGSRPTGSSPSAHSAALLSEGWVPGVTREEPIGTPGLTRVPQGKPEQAGVPQGTTEWTGVSEVAEEEAAAADNTPSFTLTKSSKGRGRLKVRKQQKAPAKKRRMSLGMERASKLVQGALAPVPNVTNLVKLLDKDYSYNDIHKSVRSLSCASYDCGIY